MENKITVELTEEEYKLVLDRRKREERFKPIKTGKTNRVLYNVGCMTEFYDFQQTFKNIIHDNSIKTEKELTSAIRKFIKRISEDMMSQVYLVLDNNEIEEGTIFDCYLDESKREYWVARDLCMSYDRILDDNWAEKNLTEIKELK